ncbi:hypothetical protein BRD03_02760 [Halobacteriales archaeon QS_9_68_17]|nr:MAG: hypothetical protein BRD03_02760 [Halobacteriales archaeon QS_9_68_17]
MERPNEEEPDGPVRGIDGTFRTRDPDSVVERRYDRPDVGTVTEVVVSGLAAAADADPLDLTPLTASVDPDALDELFRHASCDAMLTFEHDGYRVRVSGEGRVVVTPKR